MPTDTQQQFIILQRQQNVMQMEILDLQRGHTGILTQIAENTKITTEIKDILTAGRIGTSVIKWVASIVLALGIIWTASKTIINQ